MKSLLSTSMVLLCMLVSTACANHKSATPGGDLQALLAQPSRAAEDRARDAGRRPAQVIEFLGVRPGMRVIDIVAAGGYYTEVLSLAVGASGLVVAQNPPFVLKMFEGKNEKVLSERLSNGRLGNVQRLNKAIVAAADQQGFDVALTALNFHDVYHRGGAEAGTAFLQAIGKVLKPGGVLGLIDHRGRAGADNATLHRIEKSKAVSLATAAGFTLEAESTILSSSADDHSQAVFAEGVRGKTDRFLLRLRKTAEK